MIILPDELWVRAIVMSDGNGPVRPLNPLNFPGVQSPEAKTFRARPTKSDVIAVLVNVPNSASPKVRLPVELAVSNDTSPKFVRNGKPLKKLVPTVDVQSRTVNIVDVAMSPVGSAVLEPRETKPRLSAWAVEDVVSAAIATAML
jgi:hypothetical protein